MGWLLFLVAAIAQAEADALRAQAATEVDALRRDARTANAEAKRKVELLLTDANTRAAKLISDAEARAQEIAGDAYRALQDAAQLERTATSHFVAGGFRIRVRNEGTCIPAFQPSRQGEHETPYEEVTN